jgi:AGZA family xanthine/uracil permease-like MFS transporter
LFIAFVGLQNAKLVVARPATLVGLGSFSDAGAQLAGVGLILTAVLMARRVRAAILLGIAAATALGMLRGLSPWPTRLISLPHPAGTLLKLDLPAAFRLGLADMVFAFFFVDLFDNIGTLVGVCERAGFMQDGQLPRTSRALLADATGTVFGALTGTSTVTSYIESAAGVAAGAR